MVLTELKYFENKNVIIKTWGLVSLRHTCKMYLSNEKHCKLHTKRVKKGVKSMDFTRGLLK